MREMREEQIFRVLHCVRMMDLWYVEVGLISFHAVNAAELLLQKVYGESVSNT